MRIVVEDNPIEDEHTHEWRKGLETFRELELRVSRAVICPAKGTATAQKGVFISLSLPHLFPL
jgi:hypothetical protein